MTSSCKWRLKAYFFLKGWVSAAVHSQLSGHGRMKRSIVPLLSSSSQLSLVTPVSACWSSGIRESTVALAAVNGYGNVRETLESLKFCILVFQNCIFQLLGTQHHLSTLDSMHTCTLEGRVQVLQHMFLKLPPYLSLPSCHSFILYS